MLRGPLQSSRCPAIPKKRLSGSSQSSRNRDLHILQSGGLQLDSGFSAILRHFRWIALRLDWMSRLHLDCESRRQVGAPTRGQAQPGAIRETGFSRSSQSYRNRVDNISQSCGLWMDCRFNAILTRFRRIASGLQPNAIDRPGIALPSQSGRNQSPIPPSNFRNRGTINPRTPRCQFCPQSTISN